MPPRYAYWTIIVDNQPTAFRSGSQEELMPTFKRLKAKNESAVMMWWQNGKLWPTRLDAQEAMRARGEMGRRGDDRQAAFGDRDRRAPRERSAGAKRSAWSPRGEPSTPAPARNADNKLDWKPKGEFVPAPKRADRPERSEWKPSSRPSRDDGATKPAWKPKGSFDREERPRSFKRPDFKPSGDDSRSRKPEWKPKGSFDRERKTEWKSERKPERKPNLSFDRDRPPSRGSQYGKPSSSSKPEWKPKGTFDRERKPGGKPTTSRSDWKPAAERSKSLEWSPKSGHTGAKPATEKRKWIPKEEYKKSMGIEAKRDSKWRPGGEHKDPKQKYKDAKKAKWTKFKKNIRNKWEGKKKKDE